MSVSKQLEDISKRANDLAKKIYHNERLLELLDGARVRVSLETEYFSGLFDFGPEITEWIRNRIREQLTEKLDLARRQAKELMGLC